MADLTYTRGIKSEHLRDYEDAFGQDAGLIVRKNADGVGGVRVHVQDAQGRGTVVSLSDDQILDLAEFLTSSV